MTIDFRIMDILGLGYEYHNYGVHIKGSLIGEILDLVICAIVGLVIQFIL